MGLSFDKGFGGVAGGRTAHGAAAAILGQVGEELVHRAVFGGVDQLATEPPLGYEPSMQQLLQVKGQRGGRDPEPLGDRAGRQPGPAVTKRRNSVSLVSCANAPSAATALF
jgi:hypothetical protein